MSETDVRTVPGTTGPGEVPDGDAAVAEPVAGVAYDPQPTDEAADAPRRRGRPRGTSARKTRTVELVLTVTGTMDGDWQAELVHSGQRVLQGVPVPAAAVARAAKELHPDVSGAIDQVLEAAREQHRAEVERLQAELERAQRALADLT